MTDFEDDPLMAEDWGRGGIFQRQPASAWRVGEGSALSAAAASREYMIRQLRRPPLLLSADPGFGAPATHLDRYVEAVVRHENARLEAETLRYLHACVPLDELVLLDEQMADGSSVRRVVHVSQLPERP